MIGARAHGEPLADADRRLLEDFARRASAAASAVALSIEVQRSRERLVTAREEERRRLRGDLHDGLGPTLAGAVLTIDAARRLLATDPEAADALLDRAAASVEGTVADVRRLVYGLRPPALDQLGLSRRAAPARGRAQRRRARAARSPRRTRCRRCRPRSRPPRIGSPRRRSPTSRATRDARTPSCRSRSATTLRLEVADDGCGLPDDPHAGVGLTSMRERATELGGSFELAAAAGGGTVVRVDLPLA